MIVIAILGETLTMSVFKSHEGFCPDCGSVLPLLQGAGGVKCYTCKHEFGPEVFGKMESSYTIHFNNLPESGVLQPKLKNSDEAEGPIVERRCPACKNETMSYATLQLRSADEGQTVFYTCTKCKYKETENS